MDTGIVIANTGSPSAPTPDAVETYLSSYLMDPHIRQLPKIAWNILLRKAILPKRRFSSSERYRFVWEEGGAPLVAHQERLRAKVQWMCNREGLLPSATGGVSVRSAMSYGDPSMADALASLREDGSERVLCLPLYPQTASCITGSVADSFERTLAELGWDPPAKGRRGLCPERLLPRGRRLLHRGARLRSASRRPPRTLVSLGSAQGRARRGHLPPAGPTDGGRRGGAARRRPRLRHRVLPERLRAGP
ncbi:ferrochelatase [Thermophilibacter immobilis]|uniref:Ferrochelatase n=1 Tax=Thermophilibacter immobilis TaxID=2779519 RepID=A0A7S7M8I5_9ACTN|nr:ferrochelatase [Thermophilibacter immobilis]